MGSGERERREKQIGKRRGSWRKNQGGTTWWTARVSRLPNFGGNVTKFAPHEDLKSTAQRQVDFDEKSAVHRREEGNNCLAEIWSGFEEGSYLRLIDWCITQL
jgi:hypothetical protein